MDDQACEAIWRDAIKAAQIFALDPHAIGGIRVRGRRGGAIESWLDNLQACRDPASKLLTIPGHIDDNRLLGGFDVAQSLASGRLVFESGLIERADRGALVLPNAEIARPAVVAALISALDTGELVLEREGYSDRRPVRAGVVAIDEGGEIAPSLCERLAIDIDLTSISSRHCAAAVVAAGNAAERAMLPQVTMSEPLIEGIVTAAVALGVYSPRVSILAIRVAKGSAAADMRSEVSEADAAFAVRTVLGPRATRLPVQEDEDAAPPPNEEPAQDNASGENEGNSEQLADLLVAAAKAALPDHILKALASGGAAKRLAGKTGRAGSEQKTRSNGRRLGARRGDLRRGSVLDVLETVRAAAPWQKLRRRERALSGPHSEAGAPRHLEIRTSDFRVRTFKSRRETSTIFVVDASGSSAANRLAEAKGAIELLLAGCYARRDNVALISFRGKSASVMLAPTRSLARVKREVSALPGGGGTPLASATQCASILAGSELRKGRTPALVFLTDGKANITKSGVASRDEAMSDALAAARLLRAGRHAAIVIDTSPRPSSQSRSFAAEMGAKYLPLPHAGARSLSDAIKRNS